MKNAKRIENYRKNVINNFYFNKNKFEKSIRSTTSNRNNSKNSIQTIEFKINISNVKFFHFNEKFGSMNKKSKKWIESWYDEKRNFEKLSKKNRIRLTKQNKCWSCHESNYRNNDFVCINANRKNDVRLNKIVVAFRSKTIKFDISSNSKKK